MVELRFGDFEADGNLLHATPPFDAKETGLRPEPRTAADCGAAADCGGVGEGDACRVGQAQEYACTGQGAPTPSPWLTPWP